MFGDHTAFIHLGSNLGEKRDHLSMALDYLEASVGVICSASSIYETAPWGNTNQPSFLNQAVELSTKLPPFELLYEIHAIEDRMGRQRNEHWGARVIDLDILFYDKINIDYQRLTIPHPFIAKRRFVLQPLQEIASDFVHPVLGLSVKALCVKCTDESLVLLSE